MARYGSPHAAGFGSPENHLLRAKLRISADNTRGIYTATPRTGLGDVFWGLYRSARWLRNFYAAEGLEFAQNVDVPWGADSISVLALRLGHLADPSYQIERVARTFEEAGAARATLPLTFTPSVAEPIPPGTISANQDTWAFTGLDRDTHTRRVERYLTRGELDVVVTIAGLNVTISIQRDGYELCTATVANAFVGAVNFTASNSSGVTGSFNKTGALTAGTAILTVRWPHYMSILRDTVDPPTTERKQLLYEGANSVRWTEEDDLAAGTYYYRLKPVSDTGDTGTATASKSVTLDPAPAPPTNLAYSSGTAAALVLGFSASGTAGATYRLYGTSAIGGEFSLNDVLATAIAGAVTIGPVVVTGSPGFAYFVLRAVSASGKEEKNLLLLAVEFDAAGARVAGRPNVPGVLRASIAVTAGRTLAMRGIYDPTLALGTATQLQLFTRTLAGAYNFAAPDATASLSSSANGLQGATLSATLGANGWYYCKVLAATAAGVQTANADAPEFLIYVSDTDMPAGVLGDLELTRS